MIPGHRQQKRETQRLLHSNVPPLLRRLAGGPLASNPVSSPGTVREKHNNSGPWRHYQRGWVPTAGHRGGLDGPTALTTCGNGKCHPLFLIRPRLVRVYGVRQGALGMKASRCEGAAVKVRQRQGRFVCQSLCLCWLLLSRSAPPPKRQVL